MTMSKEDAKAIVTLISKDLESNKRITSIIDNILPDTWGGAGFVRNAGYVLGNMFSLGYWGDASEKEFADRVCTGISNATSQAIIKAIESSNPFFRNIKSAVTVDRQLNGTAHTATGIVMTNKSEHVFDWHATLSADNPMMFRSLLDWKAGKGGITYEEFSGWD